MAATKKKRFEPARGMLECSVCDRALPTEKFIPLTRSDKRCKPGHVWSGFSSDCRECRIQHKRDVRRKKADAAARPFVARSDRDALRVAREAKKLQRAVAYAVCLAFWAIRRYGAQERKAKYMERSVVRQRERRQSYRDVLKARKIKRKRAMEGAHVEVVSLLRVAERDNWTCYLCQRAVVRFATIVREQWSMEHVVPLSKGGDHSYSNVRLAHRGCNSSKSNKLPSSSGTTRVDAMAA